MNILIEKFAATGRFLLVLGLGVALAGCAALRVDVDVYKGPLANTDETQLQQLASMAQAAKPLLLAMRNSMLRDADIKIDGDDKKNGEDPHARTVARCKGITFDGDDKKNGEGFRTAIAPTCASAHIRTKYWDKVTDLGKAQQEKLTSCKRDLIREARQINGILSFYESQPSDWTATVPDWDPAGWGRARPSAGIDELTATMVNATAKRRDANTVNDSTHYQKLESLLVDFAARVQFYVTNSWLVGECQRDAEIKKRTKPLLETIANTILVQADETRRKDQHPTQTKRYGEMERAAASSAFSASPRQVSDHMLSALSERHKDQEKKVEGLVDDLAKEEKRRQAELNNVNGVAGLVRKKEAERVVADRAAMLLATLGFRKVNPAVRAGHSKKMLEVINPPVDKEPAWAADAQAVSTAFGAGTKKVPDATATLDAWFTKEVKGYKNFDAVQAQRARRLIAAQEALKGLSVQPSVPQDAEPTVKLTDLQSQVTQNFSASHSKWLRAGEELAAELAAVAPPESKVPTKTVDQITADLDKAKSEVKQTRAVRELIASLLPEVLAAMGSGGVQDAQAIPTQLRLTLEASKSEPPVASDSAKLTLYDKAIEFARGFRVAVASVPPLRTDTQNEAKPIDVVDSIIALLRNQHLEAIRRVGNDATESKYHAAALAQAVEYRTNMVYVRSASAYLRSALPATFLQGNPQLGRSNILLDPAKNMVRRFFGVEGDSDLEHKSKVELDKTFWQNINTVNVSASGSSNFVLAKDDVGNWYVKAMGADPKEMVNAAKNLALFNLGGKFDANLMRLNDLQTKLDNDPDESAADRRKRWTEEAAGRRKDSPEFKVTASGSAALKLFKENYDKLTVADVLGVQEGVPTLPGQISKLWQSTFREDPPRLQAVEALASDFVTPITIKLASTAAKSAPADRVIEALKSVDSYRISLASKIASASEMTVVELAKLAAEQEKNKVLNSKLATADQQLRDATTRWNDVRSSLPSDIDSTTYADLKGKLVAVEGELALRLSERADAAEKLTDATKSLTQAQSTLALARQRQISAAENVHQVLRPFIAAMVAKRLRTVQELETATNVIGQRSQ